MYKSMDVCFSRGNIKFWRKSSCFIVLVSQRKVPRVPFRNGLLKPPIKDEFWSPVWTRNSLDSFSPSFPEPSSSSGDGGPSLSVLSEEVVCTICLGHPRGNVYQVRKTKTFPHLGKFLFLKKNNNCKKEEAILFSLFCYFLLHISNWR